MPNPIRINNADEFDSLMQGLARDIVNANIHFQLHQDLNNSIPNYCTEFNQSPTFWNLAISAQVDAALIRLCRAFDSHGASLSLPRLLATIQANKDIFNTPDFKARLKDNPFVESLAKDNRIPDEDQLVRDIELVSDTNSLVARLLAWRNNIGAHRNPKETLVPSSVIGVPLEFLEIGELLKIAIQILNRYSQLFRALTYSVSMVGADDYKHVLSCIRKAIEEHDRQFYGKCFP